MAKINKAVFIVALMTICGIILAGEKGFSSSDEELYSHYTRQVTVNLDEKPYLVIDIPEHKSAWSLSVFDEDNAKWGAEWHIKEYSIEEGLIVCNIREDTPWRGEKSFKIKLTVPDEFEWEESVLKKAKFLSKKSLIKLAKKLPGRKEYLARWLEPIVVDDGKFFLSKCWGRKPMVRKEGYDFIYFTKNPPKNLPADTKLEDIADGVWLTGNPICIKKETKGFSIPFVMYRGYGMKDEDILIWEEKWRDSGYFAGLTIGEWDAYYFGGVRNKVGVATFLEKEPANGKEAYKLQKENFARVVLSSLPPNLVLSELYPCLVDHYTCEWGVKALGMELIQSRMRPGTQLRVASCRGASRQYSKPWGTDISVFREGNTARLYDDNLRYGDYRPKWRFGPNIGPSRSLTRRHHYACYMSGAEWLVPEIPFVTAYTDFNKDGIPEFSPDGVMYKEFYQFSRRHPDRGTTYTPVGVMLDFYHGYLTPFYLRWGIFPFRREEHMITGFFDTAFSTSVYDTGENGFLSNGPFGDIFDILLSNAPEKVIESYRVIFLVGGVEIDKELAQKLLNYVKAGGTVVVNSTQVNEYLPEEFLGASIKKKTKESTRIFSKLEGNLISSSQRFTFPLVTLKKAKLLMVDEEDNPLVTINRYGKGNVLLTLPHYLLDSKNEPLSLISHLLGHITSGLLPVKVIGDCEYMINKVDDGWIITLINNKGVSKGLYHAAIIDIRETKDISLVFNGVPEEVEEWINEEKVACKREGNLTKVHLSLLPGEVKIVKIKGRLHPLDKRSVKVHPTGKEQVKALLKEEVSTSARGCYLREKETLSGEKIYILENELIKVGVVPNCGGRIAEYVYKPTNHSFLADGKGSGMWYCTTDYLGIRYGEGKDGVRQLEKYRYKGRIVLDTQDKISVEVSKRITIDGVLLELKRKMSITKGSTKLLIEVECKNLSNKACPNLFYGIHSEITIGGDCNKNDLIFVPTKEGIKSFPPLKPQNITDFSAGWIAGIDQKNLEGLLLSFDADELEKVWMCAVAHNNSFEPFFKPATLNPGQILKHTLCYAITTGLRSINSSDVAKMLNLWRKGAWVQVEAY